MRKLQMSQYVLALAIFVVGFLSDDRVLELIGAWLGPSAVTLLVAAVSAARRAAPVPIPEENTAPLDVP